MRDGKIVAAVTGMDHGHINGMTEGIGEAGAVIKWAYDPDTEKTKTFLDHFQKFQVKEAKIWNRSWKIQRLTWCFQRVFRHKGQIWESGSWKQARTTSWIKPHLQRWNN